MEKLTKLLLNAKYGKILYQEREKKKMTKTKLKIHLENELKVWVELEQEYRINDYSRGYIRGHIATIESLLRVLEDC